MIERLSGLGALACLILYSYFDDGFCESSWWLRGGIVLGVVYIGSVFVNVVREVFDRFRIVRRKSRTKRRK